MIYCHKNKGRFMLFVWARMPSVDEGTASPSQQKLSCEARGAALDQEP